ncbi:RcnB family protein [Brevundimonas sp.]|uniref:RcnB family protein n=1 Tax=Brevundimonas sp. TaxID=1871086 RepID=UPI003BAC6540
MNRKMITTALAALTAVASIGSATAASAQSRAPAPGHNAGHNQGHQSAPARTAPNTARTPARAAPPRATPAPVRVQPQAQAQTQTYGRWQQSQRRYSAARYTPPRGQQARTWSYGQRLPSQYRSRSYVVSNYASYGLRAPPRGQEYVRTGNDVVLTAVATGLITAVIAGLFN